MEPRAIYDAEAGALVVELAAGVVSGTIPFPDDAHLVDVDADGRVLSLEILVPDRPLIDQIAAQFGFQDDAAAITAVVSAALPDPPARTATKWWGLQHVDAKVQISAAHASTAHSASGWAPARELDLTK
jgi:uncharacterized protein YuzE